MMPPYAIEYKDLIAQCLEQNVMNINLILNISANSILHV